MISQKEAKRFRRRIVYLISQKQNSCVKESKRTQENRSTIDSFIWKNPS